jgi:hypothetical protein
MAISRTGFGRGTDLWLDARIISTGSQSLCRNCQQSRHHTRKWEVAEVLGAEHGASPERGSWSGGQDLIRSASENSRFAGVCPHPPPLPISCSSPTRTTRLSPNSRLIHRIFPSYLSFADGSESD